MEADMSLFSETLYISCQNHSIGLSELVVSPSLKILHISACALQETVTTTVMPKLLYSTNQDINFNSDQANLFIEFPNVGIPFELPLSVPQVEFFLQNHPLAGKKEDVKRCRESITIYGDVGCYNIFTVICIDAQLILGSVTCDS